MNFLIVIATFIVMEFVAWSVHKYVMHGFLWVLHKDHHVVDKDKVLQKNDYFFLIFAIPSMMLIFIGYKDFSYQFFIGIGIAFYGLAYFIVHEIIIHRRLPAQKTLKVNILKQLEKHIKFITKIEVNIMGLTLGC